MKVCYFDCPSGAGGDMLLASLLDTGISSRWLRSELNKLGLTDYSLKVSHKIRNGVAARQLIIRQKDKIPALRTLPGISRMIKKAGFSKKVVQRSLAVLTRLAEAEAKIHNLPVNRIHFHEIGAVDTIIDVVGTMLVLEQLKIDDVQASTLPMGSGTITFSHGTLPIPAPATVELLKGVEVYSIPIEGETVTPTAAAILSTICSRFGNLPAMKIEQSGYGAGKSEFPGLPNMVRAIIGEASKGKSAESAVVLEANVDDMLPEHFEYLMAQLQKAGALDVSMTPTMMKKNRLGTIITVIGPREKLKQLAQVLLLESSTIGLRHWEVGRIVLPRTVKKIRTKYGTISVKLAYLEGEIVNAAPEYEDCRRAADRHKAPLKSVYNSALFQAMKKGFSIK